MQITEDTTVQYLVVTDSGRVLATFGAKDRDQAFQESYYQDRHGIDGDTRVDVMITHTRIEQYEVAR